MNNQQLNEKLTDISLNERVDKILQKLVEENGGIYFGDNNDVMIAKEAIADLFIKLVEDSRPGTNIVSTDDFKSLDEQNEWVGYCKAVENYEENLINAIKGEK